MRTAWSDENIGLGEFDRVLGGGIVPGCLVLVGGEPGIGKSQLARAAAKDLVEGAGFSRFTTHDLNDAANLYYEVKI